MSSLFCIVWAERGGALDIYFLYAPMSIYCVGYVFTVMYLLLVARNLLKYILIFFFF
jgi:hypothetical protein